jgi:tRNA(His) 5'-end guanylyltransferase
MTAGHSWSAAASVDGHFHAWQLLTAAALQHHTPSPEIHLHVMIAFFYLQLVMREFPEARMAYGESDEYSFILHKDTQLYGERDAVTDSPR